MHQKGTKTFIILPTLIRVFGFPLIALSSDKICLILIKLIKLLQITCLIYN